MGRPLILGDGHFRREVFVAPPVTPTGFRLTVLRFIMDHPGSTGRDVAQAIGVNDPLYGKHHAVSGSISYLRAGGLLEDCPRCTHCGCAQSRGLRDVVLTPTPLAYSLLGRTPPKKFHLYSTDELLTGDVDA